LLLNLLLSTDLNQVFPCENDWPIEAEQKFQNRSKKIPKKREKIISNLFPIFYDHFDLDLAKNLLVTV